jgi:CDP-2,3-bis-(O-geranylgeranyl)-sn-glycerol synthase
MLEKIFINAIIFIFPAFVANGIPTILGKGKRFNAPIDGGHYWFDGKRILGDGKTVRGFVSGVLGGIVTCVAIIVVADQIHYPLRFMNIVNYPITNKIMFGALVGFLLGFGALFGDIVGSFIKRRSGLQRGESYMFMDQLGFLVTALLFTAVIIPWPIAWIIFLVPSTLILHVGTNLLSYRVGLQNVPL